MHLTVSRSFLWNCKAIYLSFNIIPNLVLEKGLMQNHSHYTSLSSLFSTVNLVCLTSKCEVYKFYKCIVHVLQVPKEMWLL